MDIIQIIEIFAFVTGIIYIILEIGQKNSMWAVGILTGVACSYSFAVQQLWASMGLNVYYVAMSVWGLYQWRRDSMTLKSDNPEGATIHLAKPGKAVLLWSAVLMVIGTAGMIALLRALGDSSTVLDAVVAVMSAIGTWWLAKSYPQQWLIWIVADILSTVLCLVSGMYWMAILYLAYTLSAIYGYWHWTKNGRYINTNK
ncbi:MAG: nicotinamide mononucleotide transporter [Bacteroidales bacterium]|nr:nicotinamide mononucleotide transporter [Bacteroidales bacterium]MCR5244264.1 nicotinamide riboside transporter PnuC [Bacteroidales bacterium]